MTDEAEKCIGCGEIFEGEKDPLDEAYRAYRDLHGIPQPEAITNFRVRNRLSSADLAILMGFDIRDLERYEKGALPTEEHAAQLKATIFWKI